MLLTKKNLKKGLIHLVLLLILSASFISPAMASFWSKQEGMSTVGGSFGATTDGTPSKEMYDIVLSVINFLLGFVGILLTILILLAGYEWMTANGDEKKVAKAKDRIRDAVVGLVIVLSAYIIADYAIAKIAERVQGA